MVNNDKIHIMSRNESLFINSMTLKGKDTQISFNPIIAKNRINEIDQEIKMREQEIVLLLKEKSRLCRQALFTLSKYLIYKFILLSA